MTATTLAERSLVVSVLNVLAAGLLARRNVRLDAMLRERSSERRRVSAAKAELNRYADPLMDAAWHLGHRIDGIRNFDDLSPRTHPGDSRTDDLLMSTLYRVGQYFAWNEIVRGELRLLRFQSSADTKRTADLLEDVTRAFAKDEVADGTLRIGRDQQRAIRELMTSRGDGGAPSCINYAAFCQTYDATLARWFGRFPDDLRSPEANHHVRLAMLQTALASLVAQLDEDGRCLDDATGRPQGWSARSPDIRPPGPR